MRTSMLLPLLVACSENNFSKIGEPSESLDTGTTPAETPPTEDVEDPEEIEEEEVPDPIEEPIADAGADQAATATDAVTLDGAGSRDPAGLEPLVYEWILVSAPADSAATLDDSSAVQPVLATDVFGEYVLELTVQNTAGIWDSTPDEVVITAAAQEPVADAGADQVVPPLEDAVLDGAASYDPGGLEPLVYEWTLVSQPPGSTTSLNNPAIASPEFFADLAGDYVFSLRVMNTEGIWDSTADEVVITAEPLEGFYVQLSWDVASDLDIHLLEENGVFFDSPSDCNFCNVNPAWGAPGGADNPSLDADAIAGFGPETITIEAPSDQIYTVKAHYYGVGGGANCGGGGCPPSMATVDIFLDGTLRATYSELLIDNGDVWTAATIEWPTGIITPVGTVGTSAKTICF